MRNEQNPFISLEQQGSKEALHKHTTFQNSWEN